MVIGSLCSGYGGLDMGLQNVLGGKIAWHFEYDKHPSKILAHHYPHVPNYGDITDAKWADIEPVDWLTAGYPCQPFSTAGQRKGTEDARHLWPYIADAIRVLRPGNILLENVAGHLSLGFGRVLGDLASMGYDAQWVCVRAADAGAPHNRLRVFITAHSNSDAREKPQRTDRGIQGASGSQQHRADRQESGRGSETFANADSRNGTQSKRIVRRQLENSGGKTIANSNVVGRQALQGETSNPQGGRAGHSWPGFGPYQGAIQRWEKLTRPAPEPVDDQNRLNPPFVEWLMGLPEGWVTQTGLPYTAQLRALGNGVVPQQAALAIKLMGYGND